MNPAFSSFVMHRAVANKSNYCFYGVRKMTTSSSPVYNNSHATRAGKSPAFQQSIGTLLKERGQKFEHKDLFIVPSANVRETFHEIDTFTDWVTNGIHALSIRPGQHRLLSCLPDIPETIHLFLGAARTGAGVIVFPPVQRIEHLINKIKSSEAKFAAVPDVLGKLDYVSALQDASPEIDVIADTRVHLKLIQYPKLRFLISVGKLRHHGFLPFHYLPIGSPLISPLKELAKTVTGDFEAMVFPREGSDAGDAITHAGLVNTGHAILEAISVTINDRIVMAAPFNSIGFYVVIGCISHGSVFVHPAKTFSAEATFQSISRDRGTILVIDEKDVPKLMTQAEKARNDLSSLHTVLIWGKLTGDVSTQLKNKLKVREVYAIGSVEGRVGQLNGFIQTADGTVAPLPFSEAKIVGADGQPAPLGTSGTILTKGPHVLGRGDNKVEWLDTKISATMDSTGSFTQKL